MTDFSFLFDLEKQLHSFETRSDKQKLSSLLSDTFFEFGASGKVWTRQDILEHLSTEDRDKRIESSDYKATPLSDEVVLVTYVTLGDCLRSSVWRKKPQGWQMEFHQGTKKA